MREPFDETVRRGIHPLVDAVALELAEDFDSNEKKAVPQADLEKKRIEYIFSETPGLKPAHIGDIRGMPHVVEDIRKFIAFLKGYQKFKERDVRVQPGIFLCGPPGTGKTLTARVIATESDAKLIDAGGFPREERGWKAEDVSSLFALAKEYHTRTKKPVIIYFDEIDAVCPSARRGRYRTEASSVLMAELDGMGGKPEGIFVIAAANSGDVDEGLLRAGRLGHHIHYRSPDYRGRLEILEFYLEKKPHEPVDVEGLAKIMPRMTPAEIEELVERAYMEASLDFPDTGAKLTEADLIGRLLEEVLGPPKGTWPTDSARQRACIHEAGHVIVGEQLGCPAKLVIVPKKGYRKGVTLFDSWEEDSPTPGQIESRIAASYGGEAAEEIIFGERHLGGTDDVGKATELSIKLVANWEKTTNYLAEDDPGLCEIEDNRLLLPLDDGERSSIYSEARRIRERCYQRAKEVLKEFGKENIEYVAGRISEREFLLGKDVGRVVLEAKKIGDEKIA